MGQIGQMIAASASRTPLYAERLLKDIPAASFARLARPGGLVVQSNHPAFIVGHLSLYPALILAQLGRPAGDAAPPPGYESLFKAGVACQDDPDGRIYPAMDELTTFFYRSTQTAMGAVAEASDAQLLAPNPAEGRSRELCPTIGAVIGFYLNGHAMSHLGQLSAWRRMMGMPAA